jgi:hypothetical protein
MDEHVKAGPQQWLTEQHLIYHIQCQLAMAVKDAKKFSADNADKAKWLDNWGAQISLVLAVNNKDDVAPGLSLNHPLANAITAFSKNGDVTTPRSRTVGLGFNWSADATRTETIGFFYSFKQLAEADIDTDKCKTSQGPYLSSDLKITDFLMKGLDMSFQPDALFAKSGESPYQTFTYEVKFIVTTGGNLNPGWTLLRVSVDPTGSLYALSRIHTDDLTITMGPIKTDDKTGAISPSDELTQRHNADLIGQAVANALQTRPHP